jgi:hypothetical protein
MMTVITAAHQLTTLSIIIIIVLYLIVLWQQSSAAFGAEFCIVLKLGHFGKQIGYTW